MPVVVEKPSRSFVFENKDDKNQLTAFVNSFHHQGVRFHQKDPDRFYRNKKMQVLAISPTGMQNECTTIVEAMQGIESDNFWISCQWHPEYDHDVNPVSAKLVDMYEQILIRSEK
jgi:gamma-glutamyl-gamma-aminobutyrate hydrolase PuuD